jgi:hypothetical protein
MRAVRIHRLAQAAGRATSGPSGTFEGRGRRARSYMREQHERLSPKNEVAKAISYMLVCWASFTRFLDDGRICLSNGPGLRSAR